MIATLVAIAMLLALPHQEQKPQAPFLRFEPETLRVDRDASGYVQAMVPVFTSGTDTVRLTGITGSCGCASASIQRAIATKDTPAKFYCAINAKHFKDTLNTVEYTITHSGANSPARYYVVVRCVQPSK
ncbi:MAG: hypothetical protein FJ211_01555 [Ignavibacteria bacterium]|nr:hypothetical protein [Ignavibacteria bacterium]